MSDLTARRTRFVDEYLLYTNGTQSFSYQRGVDAVARFGVQVIQQPVIPVCRPSPLFYPRRATGELFKPFSGFIEAWLPALRGIYAK